mgnify:CR=1 FL=1
MRNRKIFSSNNLKTFVIIYEGDDLRNYGLIKGLNSARKLGGLLLGVNYKNVIANGTSS